MTLLQFHNLFSTAIGRHAQSCAQSDAFLYTVRSSFHQLSDQQLHSISPLAQHYVLPTELCPVIFEILTPPPPTPLFVVLILLPLSERDAPFHPLQLPPPTTQVVSKCHHSTGQGVGSDSGTGLVD